MGRIQIQCSSCGQMYELNSKCDCRKRYNKQRSDGFYTTKKWRTLRAKVIKRDEAHCQRCIAKHNIVITSQLEVHHIKPRSTYEHLQYEPTNLVTLCKSCNLELGVQEQLDFDWKVPSVYVPVL